MLSIIITAYREPKTIGKAIEQVLKNNIPENFEIIISAPDKETLSVAKNYSLRDKRIKILKDEGKGKPAALNKAFKKAKGRILVLTDGDVYIGDNSIAPLLKKLKQEDIGAVTGRPVAQEPKSSKYGYWANFLLDSAHRDRLFKDERKEFMLLSGYLFAMKNFYLHIPEDVLDDAFISQAVWNKGFRISYEPLAKVFIKNPANFNDWLKQKRRNTSSDIKIRKHFRKIQPSRSFLNEISNFYKVFLFASSCREILYSFQLLFARLFVWWLGFWDVKIAKKKFNKIWVRIESTK